LAGSVDFVMVLTRKRLSNDAVLSVTGRDIPEGEYALHADDGVLWRLDGDDLPAARDTVEKHRAAEKVGDRMMDVYLEIRAAKGTPMSAVEIAGLLGDMDNDTAGQYLRRLAANGYIRKHKRGLYVVSELSEVSEPPPPPRSASASHSDTPPAAVSEVSESPQAAPEASASPSHSDTSDSSYNSDTSDTSDTDSHRYGSHRYGGPCLSCGQFLAVDGDLCAWCATKGSQ
jgi:hypothetical protein